jgi:hypothetical protein
MGRQPSEADQRLLKRVGGTCRQMSVAPSSRDAARGYALLRLLVAYLGEKHAAGWWQTSCLDETGRQYLEMNFPRSALAAGVHAAGAAAQRLHDERIGRSRVFHLFRLPYRFEDRIHEHLLSTDQAALWALIRERETAMTELRKLVDTTLDAPEGPVQVGLESDIDSDRGVREVAKHYLSGVEKGRLCLPYFTVKATK